MNICYISNWPMPARTANSIHVMKMCQAYANIGHRVTLILPKFLKDIETGIEDLYEFYGVRRNFAIRRVPLPHLRSDILYYGIVLPLVALQTRPNLVHSRAVVSAWGLTSLFRRATIFETHGPPPHNRHWRKLFDRIVASPNLSALVVVTRALSDFIQPWLPETTRLLVAPDGVDASWLQYSLSPLEARTELGMAHEERRVAVYTGHLYQGRGIELIIELAHHLADHLFLVVGGHEADVDYYRQQTGELPNLRLVGFKPPAQMPLYLQAADVLLMPYAHRVETVGGGDTAAIASPIKMFEYMAASRPILASTLPVLQEILEDGRNALLLPYDQPKRWCEALRQLQQDNQLAAALSQRARSNVRQYTWESRAQSLLERTGFQSESRPSSLMLSDVGSNHSI